MSTQALHIAFHLTGRTFTADLDPVDHLALRPALLARYRDLTTLRYDFPIVLGGSGERASVDSLSGLMDTALRTLADHEAVHRIAAHARRLEREIRALVARGDDGPLSVVWDTAAQRLGASGETDWDDSVTRLRAAVPIDGQIVDCDATMPAALFRHVWTAIQEAKARRFRDRVAALLLKLSDILRADFARSPAGRTTEALRASLGASHEETFDFDAMSRLLSRGEAAEALPAARRQRIEKLIQILGSQRFYAASESSILVARGAPPPRAAAPRDNSSLAWGPTPTPAAGADSLGPAAAGAHSFVFDSCHSAFIAYRERAAEMAELAQVLAVAELEVRGDYHDSHEVFFGEDQTGASSLDPEELALFPDYLVILNEATLTPVEQATLIEMLMSGLPVNVLLQTDDLLAEPSTMDQPVNPGARARQLVQLAISLHDVYAMQASASHLFQYRHRIEAGLRYAGPSLFSVFSGATGINDLPPYLVAAAAMESRAFPAFTYDPSSGSDWASRFSLDGNPQVGVDWPVYTFSYEDEAHQHATEDLGFTLVDFIACDPRHGRHFATVPKRSWNGHLVPVADAVLAPQPGTAPSLLMVDTTNHLHKAVVSEPVLREARRCRQVWRSLQELAGINNSHVERRLARAALESRAPDDPVPVPASSAAPARSVPDAPAELPASDDPYVETPRCTTCNECTGVNNVMFAYNENKQAYVANPGAGTYAQLVEAAESCQVSIIHPGKPRNLDEPGLADLLKRAEPFL